MSAFSIKWIFNNKIYFIYNFKFINCICYLNFITYKLSILWIIIIIFIIIFTSILPRLDRLRSQNEEKKYFDNDLNNRTIDKLYVLFSLSWANIQFTYVEHKNSFTLKNSLMFGNTKFRKSSSLKCSLYEYYIKSLDLLAWLDGA